MLRNKDVFLLLRIFPDGKGSRTPLRGSWVGRVRKELLKCYYSKTTASSIFAQRLQTTRNSTVYCCMSDTHLSISVANIHITSFIVDQEMSQCDWNPWPSRLMTPRLTCLFRRTPQRTWSRAGIRCLSVRKICGQTKFQGCRELSIYKWR